MLPQEEICSNIPSRKNQEEKSIQRTLGNYSWITSKIYCEFHWMDVEWHQSGFGLKPKIFKLSIGTSSVLQLFTIRRFTGKEVSGCSFSLKEHFFTVRSQ